VHASRRREPTGSDCPCPCYERFSERTHYGAALAMQALEQHEAVVLDVPSPAACDPASYTAPMATAVAAAAATAAGATAGEGVGCPPPPPPTGRSAKRGRLRLLDSMLAPSAAATRAASFAGDGLQRTTHDYNAYSWTVTTLIVRNCALGNFIWPWAGAYSRPLFSST